MVVVAVSTLGVVLADVMEILELVFEEDDDPASPVERNEPRCGKTNILDSDLVQHKPGCTATEDG